MSKRFNENVSFLQNRKAIGPTDLLAKLVCMCGPRNLLLVSRTLKKFGHTTQGFALDKIDFGTYLFNMPRDRVFISRNIPILHTYGSREVTSNTSLICVMAGDSISHFAHFLKRELKKVRILIFLKDRPSEYHADNKYLSFITTSFSMTVEVQENKFFVQQRRIQ